VIKIQSRSCYKINAAVPENNRKNPVCKTYYSGFESLRKDEKYAGKRPRNCLTNP